MEPSTVAMNLSTKTASCQPEEMTDNPPHSCLPVAPGRSNLYLAEEETVRLNHYTSKSEEEWETKKLRGRGGVGTASSRPRHGTPPEEYSVDVDLRAQVTLLATCNPRAQALG